MQTTVRPGYQSPLSIPAALKLENDPQAPAATASALASEVLSRAEAIQTSEKIEAYIAAAMARPPAANTPVITQAAEFDTALVGPVEYRPYICGTGVQIANSDGQADPFIRFGPGNYFTNNGGESDLAMYGEIKPGGAAQFARWPVDSTFITSANNSVVEIAFYSLVTGGDAPMFEIDGYRLSDFAPIRTPGGNAWKLTLTFPYAASRRITARIPGVSGLVAIRVPAGNSISKPVDVIGRLICGLADSFQNGAGVGYSGGALDYETYFPLLAHFMGADSRLMAGIGGTGFVSEEGVSNYITRVPFILTKNPHVVIVQGSINDPQDGEGVEDASSDVLALLEDVPEVYVLGVLSAGWDGCNDALEAAAAAAGRPFIRTNGFIYGSGNISDKKGDGNADYLRGPDNIHPTGPGQIQIAIECFREIGFRPVA